MRTLSGDRRHLRPPVLDPIDPMQITYVLSQYPARSETFIAREMRALSAHGHSLTIARLRWSDTGTGLTVPDAEVLPLMWNPLEWMLGIGWALVHAPRALLWMTRDIFTEPPLSGQWARLFVLGLITLALARHLDPRSVDHLRAHFLDSEAIAAHWLSRLLDVPYSVTVHTRETRFPSALLTRVATGAAFCATISADTTRMMQTMGVPPQNVQLIRNGLSFSGLRPASHSPTPPPWKLLAVGRLVEQKGIDTLLEACARLRDWGRPFRCHIIGEGPCQDRLVAQTRRLHIVRQTTFYGAQPNEEVYRALRHHDILVAPCRLASDGHRDGLPTVLLEALSCGVPVVASAFAAIPELVVDGETGRLVPPDAPVALARTLRRLFDRPREACRMARRGREVVRRRFRLEREVDTLDAWIRATSRSSSREELQKRPHAPD